MRVRHTTNPVITEDTSGKDILLSLDDQTAEAILDGFTSQTSDVRDLLASSGAFNVPFGAVSTGKGFFLRADGDFDLEINGSQKFQIRRGATGAGGAVFTSAKVLMEADVSSLVVTPLADLRLIWAVWGDPLP